MHEGCQEISGIKANDSVGKSNFRNHRNPKLSDSASNHESVKAFGFSGTTQLDNLVSVIKSNSKARRLSRPVTTQKGIDLLNLHSVQPGYQKDLPKPIQTKAVQNREKINEVKPQYEEHNKSIYHIRQCNISIVKCMKRATKNHRCDDSADHHKAVWYSGTATQLATTSKTALDLSGTTFQSADHNVQKNSASKGLRLNISYNNKGAATNSSLLSKQLHGELNRSHYKLKSKAVKEQTSYWSTFAKTHEHCNNFALLNSDDSNLQTGINRKP
ncbi:U-box domain-containing protein 4-like [Dorcoceras hygrometricum]|uniref:U-box domain-containing protein 4-like n=1 Tax=Dorcoceras hygrometricum TaxID=472368 RepID=A0A2Z7C118_9LAMI|nr:U-box domain-containing protein 4-like [Dorcoceras hygrometricum]